MRRGSRKNARACAPDHKGWRSRCMLRSTISALPHLVLGDGPADDVVGIDRPSRRGDGARCRQGRWRASERWLGIELCRHAARIKTARLASSVVRAPRLARIVRRRPPIARRELRRQAVVLDLDSHPGDGWWLRQWRQVAREVELGACHLGRARLAGGATADEQGDREHGDRCAAKAGAPTHGARRQEAGLRTAYAFHRNATGLTLELTRTH